MLQRVSVWAYSFLKRRKGPFVLHTKKRRSILSTRVYVYYLKKGDKGLLPLFEAIHTEGGGGRGGGGAGERERRRRTFSAIGISFVQVDVHAISNRDVELVVLLRLIHSKNRKKEKKKKMKEKKYLIYTILLR